MSARKAGNRKLAIERLKRKLQVANESEQAGARKQLQQQHTNLERGNAVKIFTDEKFHG
jgi:protein subunit release factor B